MATNTKNTPAPELYDYGYPKNNAELTLSFRGTGTPLSNLQLFNDANKNAVLDPGELLAKTFVSLDGKWDLKNVDFGILTLGSSFFIRSMENNGVNVSEINSLTYTQPVNIPPPPPTITPQIKTDKVVILESNEAALTPLNSVTYTINGAPNSLVQLKNQGNAKVGSDVTFSALKGIWSAGDAAQQSATVTLDPQGQASFILTTVADNLAEGNEQLAITASNQAGSIPAPIVIVSDAPITHDQNKISEPSVNAITQVTYTLSGSANAVFNVQNTGTAKVGDDATFSALKGTWSGGDAAAQSATVILDAQGHASFILTTVADNRTEGEENFILTVSDGKQRFVDAPVVVNDTSLTVPLKITVTSPTEIVEPNGGASTANYPTQVSYTVTGAPNQLVNLHNGGTAIVGNDLAALPVTFEWINPDLNLQTVSFRLNAQGSANFTFAALADQLTEGDENLRLTVTDAQDPKNNTPAENVILHDATVPPPIFQIKANPSVISETTDTNTTAQVTYTITGGTPNATVNLNNTGTATLGVDTTEKPTSIKLDGNGVASFTLNAVADKTTEGDETLIISATDAAKTVAASAVTINDTSRSVLQITANSSSIAETAGTNSPFLPIQVSYTITGGTPNATVNLSNKDGPGTATLGVDTKEKPTSIKLDGNGAASFTLTAVADKTTEGDETLTITAIDAQDAAKIAVASAVKISDTSISPLQITASPSPISEIPDTNTPGQAIYTVTGGTPNATINVSNTGNAILGTDTSALSSSIKLDANGAASFSLSAVADKISEGDENLVIAVADTQDPTNSAIAPAIVIRDTSRSQLRIVADQTAIFELAGANAPGQVNYTITGGTPNNTVNISNAGTAIIGTDTNAIPSSIKLDANGNASFSLSAVVDKLSEVDENLNITVSDALNPADTATASAIVIHDTPVLNFKVSNYSFIEDPGLVTEKDGLAVLAVELSTPVSQTVTVNWSTLDGSAIGLSEVPAGTTVGISNDYASTNGTLTFAPDVTTQTISIPINGDSILEPDENFSVNLSNPSANASLGAISNATVTILDNDTFVSFQDPKASTAPVYSITEGNSGTTILPITVYLEQTNPYKTVTVDYATSNANLRLNALAPSDYLSTSGTLTFDPGVTQQVINVPIVGDTVFEGTENFSIQLVGVSGNAQYGGISSVSVSIRDNDG